jgi:hypothetical protein
VVGDEILRYAQNDKDSLGAWRKGVVRVARDEILRCAQNDKGWLWVVDGEVGGVGVEAWRMGY